MKKLNRHNENVMQDAFLFSHIGTIKINGRPITNLRLLMIGGLAGSIDKILYL